jgi:hypothetical protein
VAEEGKEGKSRYLKKGRKEVLMAEEEKEGINLYQKKGRKEGADI